MAWINMLVLVVSILLFLYFYVASVSPAALEKKIGENAYRRATQYRVAASVFMVCAVAAYVVSYFYPLPVLPPTFPWNWQVSVLTAVVIAVVGGSVWVKGMKDAGEETMVVKKEHTLYRGIYTKIRHPQAVGEITYWWVIAFLLHSPFLVLFSFVWIPVFYIMCLAEEKDLVIRYGEKYLEYKKNTGAIIPKRKR